MGREESREESERERSEERGEESGMSLPPFHHFTLLYGKSADTNECGFKMENDLKSKLLYPIPI